MYLKRTSAGPLSDMAPSPARAESGSVIATPAESVHDLEANVRVHAAKAGVMSAADRQ